MPALNTVQLGKGGALMSSGATCTAGHGDNQVVVDASQCTNNSYATAGVCEFQKGDAFLGSAVLAVYNVVPGQPKKGQCTVIVNSGWKDPIEIKVSVIYTAAG